jgi:hypothetical protein
MILWRCHRNEIGSEALAKPKEDVEAKPKARAKSEAKAQEQNKI